MLIKKLFTTKVHISQFINAFNTYFSMKIVMFVVMLPAFVKFEWKIFFLKKQKLAKNVTILKKIFIFLLQVSSSFLWYRVITRISSFIKFVVRFWLLSWQNLYWKNMRTNILQNAIDLEWIYYYFRFTKFKNNSSEISQAIWPLSNV